LEKAIYLLMNYSEISEALTGVYTVDAERD
jgi:hypothetical protein